MVYSQQHNEISEGHILSEALINAQNNLELSQKEIADIIHSNPPKICRLAKGGELDPKSPEGIFALHFLRIYRNLSVILANDDAQSKEWLKNYNHYFQESPINLLKGRSIQEMIEVLNYLDAMRGMA